jgi:hypothetical protein
MNFRRFSAEIEQRTRHNRSARKLQTQAGCNIHHLDGDGDGAACEPTPVLGAEQAVRGGKWAVVALDGA